MSSILKALKKLEDEKTAKQGQRVDITKDIFGASRQPAAPSRWPLFTAGGVGFIAIAAGAYFFMARPTTTTTTPPPAPVALGRPTPAAEKISEIPVPTEPTPGAKTVVPDPVPSPIQTKSVTKPPVQPSAISTAPHNAIKPKVPSPTPAQPPVKLAKPATQPAHAPQSISTNRPAVTAPRLTPQQGKTAPSSGSAASLMAPAQAPPVAVSGIAYNTSPAERLAMINGSPVAEGKSVNGVKVEEILPDRVRFSYGAKSFEVPVGRSNQ